MRRELTAAKEKISRLILNGVQNASEQARQQFSKEVEMQRDEIRRLRGRIGELEHIAIPSVSVPQSGTS